MDEDENSPRDVIPHLPIIANANSAVIRAQNQGPPHQGPSGEVHQDANETIQPLRFGQRQARSRSASYTRPNEDQRNGQVNTEETIPKSFEIPNTGARRRNASSTQESQRTRSCPRSSLNTSLHRSYSAQNIRGPYDIIPEEIEKHVQVNVHALTVRIKELEQENYDVKSKCCDLETRNCDLETRNCDLENRNCDLVSRNSKVKTQLETQQLNHQNEIQLLKDQTQHNLATIKQSLDNTKADLKLKGEKLVSTQTSYKLSVKANKDLKNKVAALEEQLKQFRDIAHDSTVASTMDTATVMSPRDVSRSSSRHSSNASPRMSPTKTNTPSNSRRSSISLTVPSDNDATLKIMSDKKALISDLVCLKKENDDLRSKLDSLKEEHNVTIAKMKEELKDKVRHIDSTNNRLQKLQEEFKGLESENKSKDSIIAVLRRSRSER